MGQNCVAGTTEFDEENGIGLVMYVESGNNMIVWKMSDGTKQGTTVPVSSEYQNMLRTAFENKTGTRIGYFIFHPYTEESINIESSITINSSDTPTKTLWKWGLNGQENPIVCGYVSKGEYEQLDAFIYTDENKPNGVAVFDETGKRLSPGVEGYAWFEQKLCDELTATLGQQVEYAHLVECPVNVNETLENWNEYIEVHP